MTREREIEIISERYGTDSLMYGKLHNDTLKGLLKHYQKGFVEGVKWADSNPKSPWISVEDDLPCNHKELLLDEHRTKTVLVVLSRNDTPSIRYIERFSMINKKGSSDVDWYWFNTTHYTVTHWMPVPKLPNE